MSWSESDSSEEEETTKQASSEDLYEQSDSLEDIAGIEVSASEPSSEDVSAMFEDKEEKSDDKPSNAPPVPASGLPEGWTMDQWEWYGHEWLAKNGDD